MANPCPAESHEDDSAIAEEAGELAEKLLHAALTGMQAQERKQARKMATWLRDLSMAMTDRLIRSTDAPRSARSWRAVVCRSP